MRWTCPKCGKKLDISNERLIANDGVIVCPQCLLQARQPIPKARVVSRADKPAAPHKPRMKQASTSYRYTGLSGNQSAPKRKQPSGKKKSNKKKPSEGMSAWGCLGRTIVFTLVLFAAYVFFGLLLEALQ